MRQGKTAATHMSRRHSVNISYANFGVVQLVTNRAHIAIVDRLPYHAIYDFGSLESGLIANGIYPRHLGSSYPFRARLAIDGFELCLERREWRAFPYPIRNSLLGLSTCCIVDALDPAVAVVRGVSQGILIYAVEVHQNAVIS